MLDYKDREGTSKTQSKGPVGNRDVKNAARVPGIKETTEFRSLVCKSSSAQPNF